MKFPICFLAVLFPAAGWAQLAGDWAGVATDSQGAHRVALHIRGPFTAMQATANIPDQKINAPVESITFSDSTLQFDLPAYDARYSGVLNDSGNIVGTLTHTARIHRLYWRESPARGLLPPCRRMGWARWKMDSIATP